MSDVPPGFTGFMAYYDSVHQHPINRLFHAFAFTQAIVGISLAFAWHPAAGLGIALLSYAWAWTGHLVFEKNRPATFHSPIRSLVFGFAWFFFLAISLGTWRWGPRDTAGPSTGRPGADESLPAVSSSMGGGRVDGVEASDGS